VLKTEEYEDWVSAQHRGLAPSRTDRPPRSTSRRPSATWSTGTAHRAGPGLREVPQHRRLAAHRPHLARSVGRREKLTDGRTITVDEGYITESMMDPFAKIVDGSSR